MTKGAGVERGGGFASAVRSLTGTGSAAPKAIASLKGSPGIAATMLRSDASDADTTDWTSLAFVRRKTTQVPHCARTVGEISEGRWVLSQRARPNFRPSFAKRS